MKEVGFMAGLALIMFLVLFFTFTKPGSEKFQVQIYNVPEAQAHEISSLLNKNFYKLSAKDEGEIARSEVLPSGQLLLFGPESIHKGFDSIVASLKPQKEVQNTEKNYQIKVWMIAGLSDEGNTPIPQEISEVVKELQKSRRGIYIKSLERIQLILGKDGQGANTGQLFQMKCSLFNSTNNHSCSIKLEGAGSFRAQFSVDTNRAIVLGGHRINKKQSRLHETLKQLPDDTELFYILKITEM